MRALFSALLLLLTACSALPAITPVPAIPTAILTPPSAPPPPAPAPPPPAPAPSSTPPLESIETDYLTEMLTAMFSIEDDMKALANQMNAAMNDNAVPQTDEWQAETNRLIASLSEYTEQLRSLSAPASLAAVDIHAVEMADSLDDALDAWVILLDHAIDGERNPEQSAKYRASMNDFYTARDNMLAELTAWEEASK